MTTVLVAAYVAVLSAELAGDRTFFALGTPAHSGAPLAVWLGGTLALATKAVLATAVGAAVRQRVRQGTLRVATVAVYLTLAVFAALPGRP